ncbi:RING-H2 finger protein ATL46-like [Lotus japonicus]|uniref:RING-H2 finger protein ATL46-like n=1 Tax=Lotus japonicus TaxID=34305 RepID=UPI002582E39B|nr:RING-H2 finger protein ATL46-like [Lotus japonicus]XP_057437288.1 RING-H2 finger protein ATL46-like [Lotus japonicus]XP_057437289.1 RING-H2 finger protein ATL46-like [Lotus japonicus]XP_057437290.1 RING-H2 finger protein ATL46-like [Lotus japonicus]
MPESMSLYHTHLKMAWIQHQIQQKDASSSSPNPGHFDKQSSAPSASSSGARISPAVLFVIVILAVLFFISGLLHLLVRFLTKKNPSSQSDRHREISNSDALERQLQQLFHLHDFGLDQAFIDALPVFQYKEITGLKEPLDCAVCLCEFSEKDNLRLLPVCSHAFHINCIDTWLLSNSTCPLCRGTLLGLAAGFSVENPIFDYDDLRDDEGCYGENEFRNRKKSVEIQDIVEKGIFPVRLGKFRRLDVEAVETIGGETSSSNLDARRCYSMGSYQYVLGKSDLRITLNNDRKSCDAKLKKESENLEKLSVEGDIEAKKIRRVGKGESYSVSKIWLWSEKGKFSVSSDAGMGMPSSLNAELPWMRETEGS